MIAVIPVTSDVIAEIRAAELERDANARCAAALLAQGAVSSAKQFAEAYAVADAEVSRLFEELIKR